jgi:uncharacterized coiled-coil protein SlyX
MDTKALAYRIECLESALAFQEKLVADLNLIVTEQQKMLDALAPQLREVSSQLRELKERSDKPVAEKPPHY